jgi:multidrug efflux pump subunit AcrA (membrane-fusion protein)
MNVGGAGQLRKFAARLRPRLLWSIVAVVVVAGVVTAVTLSQADETVPAASTTARVQRGTVALAVAAAGTIHSSQTRGLSFSIAGTVTELDVKVGDAVTAGQVLARIDPGDAQDAVTSAQSRVDDAQDAVDRAQTTANLPPCPTATPTSTTASRTPSTSPTPTPHPSSSPTPTPSPSPSSSPSPSPSSSSPSSQTAQSQGRATVQLNDVQVGVVEVVAPAVQPSNQQGQSSSGSTQNCSSGTRTSTADSVLSAQLQLNNAMLALTQANARLVGTTITAPIAGRVLSVGGKVGAKASPGGTGFVVLGDLANLTVTAQFSEADVGKLAVGQPATIGLPDRAAEVSGKVSQIDPAGTTSSRLVRYGVVIAFESVPADLLLGQSATVTVTTASVDNVLYLASAAVRGVSDGKGTVTVRAGGQDTQRTVSVGLRGDQYTEISSGLSEGDEVVLPTGA